MPTGGRCRGVRQGQGAAQRRWANQPTNIRLAPTTKDPVLRPRCTLAADNAVGTCRRAAAQLVEQPLPHRLGDRGSSVADAELLVQPLHVGLYRRRRHI